MARSKKKREIGQVGSKIQTDKVSYLPADAALPIEESSHAVRHVKKQESDKLRYQKTYSGHELVLNLASVEAMASELYAYLLGRDRTAPARRVGKDTMVSRSLPQGAEDFIDQSIAFLKQSRQNYQILSARYHLKAREPLPDEPDRDLRMMQYVARSDFAASLQSESARRGLGGLFAASYLMSEGDLHFGNFVYSGDKTARLDFDRSLEVVQFRQLLLLLNSKEGERFRPEIVKFLCARYMLFDIVYCTEAKKQTPQTYSVWRENTLAHFVSALPIDFCKEYIAGYLQQIEAVSVEDLENLISPKNYRPLANWILNANQIDQLASGIGRKIAEYFGVKQDLNDVYYKTIDRSQLGIAFQKLKSLESAIPEKYMMSEAAQSAETRLNTEYIKNKCLYEPALNFQKDKIKVLIKASLLSEKKIESLYQVHCETLTQTLFYAHATYTRFIEIRRKLFESDYLKKIFKIYFDSIFDEIRKEILDYNSSTIKKIENRIDELRKEKMPIREIINDPIFKAYENRMIIVDFEKAKHDYRTWLESPLSRSAFEDWEESLSYSNAYLLDYQYFPAAWYQEHHDIENFPKSEVVLTDIEAMDVENQFLGEMNKAEEQSIRNLPGENTYREALSSSSQSSLLSNVNQSGIEDFVRVISEDVKSADPIFQETEHAQQVEGEKPAAPSVSIPQDSETKINHDTPVMSDEVLGELYKKALDNLMLFEKVIQSYAMVLKYKQDDSPINQTASSLPDERIRTRETLSKIDVHFIFDKLNALDDILINCKKMISVFNQHHLEKQNKNPAKFILNQILALDPLLSSISETMIQESKKPLSYLLESATKEVDRYFLETYLAFKELHEAFMMQNAKRLIRHDADLTQIKRFTMLDEAFELIRNLVTEIVKNQVKDVSSYNVMQFRPSDRRE